MPNQGQIRHILVNGERVEVDVLSLDREAVSFMLNGRRYDVSYEQSVPQSAKQVSSPSVSLQELNTPRTGGTRIIHAPIPGVVAVLLVTPGTQVTQGQILLRLDAMKMENNILAPQPGTICKISITEGAEVHDGQALIEMEI